MEKRHGGPRPKTRPDDKRGGPRPGNNSGKRGRPVEGTRIKTGQRVAVAIKDGQGDSLILSEGAINAGVVTEITRTAVVVTLNNGYEITFLK